LLESGTNFVSFSEPECSGAFGVNLYQHVARGLNGGDYFVINSQFESDTGGNNVDPVAFFDAASTMLFTPMVFNGTNYQQMPQVIVDSPYEGDSVLSPSGRMVSSRLAGPNGNSLGYVVRNVDATPTSTSYDIDASLKLATICLPGTKANFSFDERFMVTHHYEGGVANLYLVDLSDGQRYRITDMPPGRKALFPHFVSNGWIYFLVRGVSGERWVGASNAALAIVNGGNGEGGESDSDSDSATDSDSDSATDSDSDSDTAGESGGEEWEGLDESGTVTQDQTIRYNTGALGAGSYHFDMTGTGDADLYVRVGAEPTLDDWDCRPYMGGSDETCDVNLSGNDTIFVMVHGYDPSSTFELTGREG
jgi:hypothetical protein